MTAPAPIAAGKHAAEDFAASLNPNQLVYFLCNVGDGDSQVLLLPVDPQNRRRILIVDVCTTKKVPALIDSLQAAGLINAASPGAGGEPDGSVALVVATHPHSDHIGGMNELLTKLKPRIGEFWDPGYYHTTQDYLDMMAAIEANPHIIYAQPTAGYKRWFGSALVTVLSPSVGLRNKFDTYGTEVNDSSLSLRVEFPAARAIKRDAGRNLVDKKATMSLILGADAQTLSWAHVLTDFPQLGPNSSDANKAIRAATGTDLLSAKVLKVSHHASKHGVNLELVERISPALTLVSNASPSGFGFPHSVAQELIREALQATASTPGMMHKPDSELGIFYTCDTEAGGGPLGSMAVVMGAGKATVWRFGDTVKQPINLANGRRWTG